MAFLPSFKLFIRNKLLINAFSLYVRWVLCRSMRLSQKSVMVFAPHQDDETLGCGGMIALKRQRGVPVSVVFLTDGHTSPSSPFLHSHAVSQMRKQEALTALKALGVEPKDIHFLDQPDSGLLALSQEKRQYLIDQLVQLFNKFKPDEVYVTYQHDFHSDHETTFELVRAAIAKLKLNVELFQYPIWALWTPWKINSISQEWSHGYRLSIKDSIKQKRIALKAYRSQCDALDSDSKAPLPPEFLSLFLSSHEIFFKFPI